MYYLYQHYFMSTLHVDTAFRQHFFVNSNLCQTAFYQDYPDAWQIIMHGQEHTDLNAKELIIASRTAGTKL